jgi:hypothetical protein
LGLLFSTSGIDLFFIKELLNMWLSHFGFLSRCAIVGWAGSLVLTVAFQNVILAATVSLFVPGSANPYLAGMPDGTSAPFGDSAPAQSPVLVAGLDIGQASYLSFSATGTASYNSSVYYGPDGGPLFSRGSENGISGIRVTASALIGVFLNSQLPTTTAAPLDLNFELLTGDFLTLSPELKQVFFIGDGRTGSNLEQKFYVPFGATRLFLATADGSEWINNGGGFTTSITSYSQAPVPEPTSAAILAPILLLACGRFHRHPTPTAPSLLGGSKSRDETSGRVTA